MKLSKNKFINIASIIYFEFSLWYISLLFVLTVFSILSGGYDSLGIIFYIVFGIIATINSISDIIKYLKTNRIDSLYINVQNLFNVSRLTIFLYTFTFIIVLHTIIYFL